jgi:biotin-(acetyl-CoA carboxylase) ligase
MQKEREQTQLEMNSLREENKAAFEENAVLQEMANEFNTFQRIFQETQQSETKLREYLT